MRGLATFAALSVAGILPLPAAAGMQTACDNSLPQVLNVGVPFDENISTNEIRSRLGTFFGERYRRLAICPSRALQVNAALGTDYQILDWLGRGSVDMAVVSALGRHILLRDGVDLLEIGGGPERTGTGWLAAKSGELRSYDASGGHRQRRLDANGDLEAFREELLRLATGEESKPAIRTRIVFFNHLATIGFLVPVSDTHQWLEQRLQATAADKDQESIRDSFWSAWFDHACFRFGDDHREQMPGCPLERGEAAATAVATIELEMATRPSEAPAPATFAPSAPVQDYLLARADVADSIFRPNSFPRATAILPATLDELFGTLQPIAKSETEIATPAAPAAFVAGGAVPRAFRSYISVEPYFGTRTFAFTVEESARLLALHQRVSGRALLALVLPGGGVKAAYQSRLIDTLYGEGYLKNQLVASAPPAAHPPLDVERVIGTSGGALLGFFVARLGEHGPWSLSKILWEKAAQADSETTTDGIRERRFLDSSDIFPFTDLPRYASLVTILVVFGLTLAAVSGTHRGWLSPPPQTETGHGRGPLLLALAASLGGTPLLVSWLSGRFLEEHVPEFEGLLFAVMVGVAMFADQCLVARAGREERQTPRNPAAMVLLVAGALFIVLPILGGLLAQVRAPRPPGAGASFPGSLLEAPVDAGVAYVTLLSLAVALALVAIRQRRDGDRPAWQPWLALLAIGVGTMLAFLLLASATTKQLEALDRTPLFFAGLVATLVAALLSRVFREHDIFVKFARRAQRFGRSSRAQATAVVLAPFLASLALLDLTRPAAGLFLEAPFRAFLTGTPSKLGAPLGAFAVSLGALLALIGFVLALPGQRSRFRLEGARQFVDSVLLLVVALALTVYAVLAAVARLWPDRMTLFELTREFWLGLLAVSLLVSSLVLLWGRLGSDRSRAANGLRAALLYLTGRHPNGNLVSRRFVRLGLIAVLGVAWWNFVVAPGLYGNRPARDYFRSVNDRFDLQYSALHPGAPSAYRLTAQLLAPANALEQETGSGTRFVLAVPGSQPCPAIRQPAGSGSIWYRFHIVDQGGHQTPSTGDGCEDLDLTAAEPRERLLDFVFASGSPFPIFPAHRVRTKLLAKEEALVDGGYTNNTPVEAAGTLGAEQVLIVNSSPLACAESTSWFVRLMRTLQGPMVDNALRLPGFFYERSQQLDRRSRASLFVVSLSPSCQPDWPLLSDFRESVVSRMLDAADQDRHRRIGAVEGWGPPRFQVSEEVPGMAR
jgi:predicted acylesterase/phospholipase RssA